MTDAAIGAEPAFTGAHEQAHARTLGMWIFLATEMLFFGALFFAYAIARVRFPDAFAAASRHTNLVLGTANTAVLLTSSLFMALGVRAAARDRARSAAAFLALTAVLGVAFAGVKLAEYALDSREHLVPAIDFAFDPRYAAGAQIFFGFYFATTGLHLVHLAVGVAIVAGFAWRLRRAAQRADSGGALAGDVEIAGLYWHFVDVVWIFLYRCLYLIART